MNKEQIREAVRHAIIEVQAIGPPMLATTFGMLASAAADRAAGKIAAQLATTAVRLSAEDDATLTLLAESPNRTSQAERAALRRLLGAAASPGNFRGTTSCRLPIIATVARGEFVVRRSDSAS